MARKGINKQQVFEIAKQIACNDQLPTTLKIRARLATGSIVTIHKYLQEWKKSCFTKINLNTNIDANETSDLAKTIYEKERQLEHSLEQQINKNENYAQELINAEKTNIFLKAENNQLQVQLQTIQLELQESRAINNALEQITKEIKYKLENNENKTIENLRQTIEGLKAELKKLNEMSLEALREASAKGHDTLMQEKVNSINLQTKVDSLYKELIDLKKQLSDTILKHQIQTQTLLRQINEQQKIIQDHIGLEKLRELVGEQQLMLHFNNKSGVAYGK